MSVPTEIPCLYWNRYIVVGAELKLGGFSKLVIVAPGCLLAEPPPYDIVAKVAPVLGDEEYLKEYAKTKHQLASKVANSTKDVEFLRTL